MQKLSWLAASSKAEFSTETWWMLWTRLAHPSSSCCHLAALDPWSLIVSCISSIASSQTSVLESDKTLQFYFRVQKNAEGSIIANTRKILTTESRYSADLLSVALGKVPFKMPLAVSMLSVLPVMGLNKWGWQQAVSKGK